MNKPPMPLWKRLLYFGVFAVIAFITLIVLTLSWISFEGRRDWSKTKGDLIARGEKLSLVELRPPPIPDSQNFFGDPMWKELIDVVDVVGDFGIPYKDARIPKGQRQIDAIDPPLSPALIERTKILFPTQEPYGPSDIEATGYFAAHRAITTIFNKYRKAPDLATQHKLAQFTLDALAPGLPARQHIEELLNRPGAVFPRDYSKRFSIDSTIVCSNSLLRIAQITNCSALAHLVLGETSAASQDIITQLRLADTFDYEPTLIAYVARLSILSMITSTINRGIVAQRWKDSELAEFETRLATIHLFHRLAFALRGERGWSNQSIQAFLQDDIWARDALKRTFQIQESMSGDIPSNNSALKAVTLAFMRFISIVGQAPYNRFIQQYIDLFEKSDSLKSEYLPKPKKKPFPFQLRNSLTFILDNGIENAAIMTVFQQNMIVQTRIACALERYRLQHGVYPDSLASLVPTFMPAIPTDVIAGQKFHYRRDGIDKFLLWSVGWNEIDEGGSIASTHDYKTADWVWNSPPGWTVKSAHNDKGSSRNEKKAESANHSPTP